MTSAEKGPLLGWEFCCFLVISLYSWFSSIYLRQVRGGQRGRRMQYKGETEENSLLIHSVLGKYRQRVSSIAN